MADFAENVTYTDAATAISQGKRHLLVRDYSAAVTAFADGLVMLSRKHGDGSDELGEPYLLYGRALLGLARTETGVLGNGVLGSEENDEVDEENEENDAKDDTADSEDEKEEEETENSASNDTKNESDTKENHAMKNGNADAVEKNSEKKDPPAEVENVPGSSKENNTDNADDAENVENGDENVEDDEEPGRGIDLQVAWEVLELAKNIFSKRGSPGYKQLAEAFRLLGEVAMESGNHQVAVTDLKQSLKILQNIEPYESRAVAELHYQLGLAHSLLNEFDTSIEQFNEAINLLENRIKQLEANQNIPKSDDPFYSVEGEIKELKELLPEIQEKIMDIKDFKQEACQLVLQGIKNKVASEEAGGASNSDPSAAGSSKEIKPASDISHLVRKKRRADELDGQCTSPSKKPTP